MNNNILFLMFGGLMILIGLEGETKAFAQSITPQTDQVMENTTTINSLPSTYPVAQPLLSPFHIQ